jgi:peptide/nickel transport system substrate-binding protein
MPFAFAVPKDTPLRNMKGTPLPATGSYVIARSDDRGLELERNPQFVPWGSPARPDGFPDRIVMETSEDPEAMVESVLDGSVDWTRVQPPPEEIPGLSTTHAAQIHPTPTTTSWFMTLDTGRPPFDDGRVRRAINLAVDRDEIARIYGPTGRSSCQILPPNFPGYEPYCPFTADGAPTWSAPDPDAARSLIEDAGVAGSHVEIWSTVNLPNSVSLAHYFAELLGSLGFRTTVRPATQNGYWGSIYSHRSQMALAAWAPDYPVPSGIIPPQFRCDAGANASDVCDPRLDEAMDRANRLQVGDPAAAAALWAEIDRDLVDGAYYVPLVNGVSLGLVSARVGNYQFSIWSGDALLDLLWVV